MGLQVIGAGFGRTGTKSLKFALETLGFRKCHHMQEVFTSRRQIEAWHALSRGQAVDWDEVFEGFEASCDWPSCTYWEELHRHYPESKVILSVRDEDRWYQSALETIYPASTEMPAWVRWLIPRMQLQYEMIAATIWDGTFDGKFEDKEHALRVFRENSERVRQVVPPERLLVFQAKDGWEPLCAFLGVPVPDSEFPHVNEGAVIKRAVRVIRFARWLPLVLLGILVVSVLLCSGSRA